MAAARWAEQVFKGLGTAAEEGRRIGPGIILPGRAAAERAAEGDIGLGLLVGRTASLVEDAPWLDKGDIKRRCESLLSSLACAAAKLMEKE